ncbi:MAG: DUF2304 domain-containing protein [Clostridia bacterium]
MTITLRIILIILSVISFLLCVKKIKQSKLKVSNSITWLVGSILLILMSIFSHGVEYIANKLGFIAPVNFVFFVIITFLLIQNFIDNIRISTLSEKIKDLNHYIALTEHDEKNK